MQIIEPSVEILTKFDGKDVIKHIELCARNCYKSEDKITDESAERMIKMLISRGHDSLLEHFQITARLICSIACYKDLTRHRHASYAIESTRWCGYNKGKFNSEIKFIRPINIPEDSLAFSYWEDCMLACERYYMGMSAISGVTPDETSLLLPQATAASVIMTANLRELRHIFSLRCDKAARPEVRYVMTLLLNKLAIKIPVVFDDLFERFNIED